MENIDRNMKSEKTARKIGEVLAFTILGIEIFHKGQKALEGVLGADFIEEVSRSLKTHKKQILSLVEGTELAEVTLAKAQSTQKKLQTMQDLYLQDQWDDPTEIMEWLGFFEGAAAVHWGLVTDRLIENDVKKIAKNCKEFHLRLLNTLVEKIK